MDAHACIRYPKLGCPDQRPAQCDICPKKPENFKKVLVAGDNLAHQLSYPQAPNLLEAWWQIRGGHDKCTVCNAVALTPVDPHT